MTFKLTKCWNLVLADKDLKGLIVIEWAPPDNPDTKLLHFFCWRPTDWFHFGRDKEWCDGPWNGVSLGIFGGYFWRW